MKVENEWKDILLICFPLYEQVKDFISVFLQNLPSLLLSYLHFRTYRRVFTGLSYIISNFPVVAHLAVLYVKTLSQTSLHFFKQNVRSDHDRNVSISLCYIYAAALILNFCNVNTAGNYTIMNDNRAVLILFCCEAKSCWTFSNAA